MDLGSGIPDPGVKKAPDPGSGSATLGCNLHNNFVENFVKMVGDALFYTIHVVLCFH